MRVSNERPPSIRHAAGNLKPIEGAIDDQRVEYFAAGNQGDVPVSVPRQRFDQFAALYAGAVSDAGARVRPAPRWRQPCAEPGPKPVATYTGRPDATNGRSGGKSRLAVTMTTAGCAGRPRETRERTRSEYSGLPLTGKLCAETPFGASRTYRPLVRTASAHAASSWKRRQSRGLVIARGAVRFNVRGSGSDIRPSRLVMKLAYTKLRDGLTGGANRSLR